MKGRFLPVLARTTLLICRDAQRHPCHACQRDIYNPLKLDAICEPSKYTFRIIRLFNRLDDAYDRQ